MRLDTILTNPPIDLLETYSKLVPRFFHKFDKQGHPILIQKLGLIVSLFWGALSVFLCLGAIHFKILSTFTKADKVDATVFNRPISSLVDDLRFAIFILVVFFSSSDYPIALDLSTVAYTHAYDMEVQCQRAREQTKIKGYGALIPSW